MQAYIWALAHPAQVTAAAPTIGRLLRQTTRVNEGEVNVSASSGWISYFDRARLWQKFPPSRLPATAADASKHAEDFLRDFAQALASPVARREAPTLGKISLLPPTFEPIEVVAVPSRDARGWDHWLYRAQPELTLSPKAHRSIAILGSQIEVRVGDGGKIISLRSRYRPVTSERVTADLIEFEPAAHSHSDSHTKASKGAHKESGQSLVYLLDGDGIPQHYLAPYYLFNAGHEMQLASASAYSLMVALNLVQEEEGTRVTAIVEGGSGDYRYDWGYYPIDSVMDGYRDLGPGIPGEVKHVSGRSVVTSTVRLETGAHVVLLNIKDRKTGAFKHHQQSVFSSPVSDRGTQQSATLV